MIPTDERELLISEPPLLVPRDSPLAQEKMPFISMHTIPMHSEVSDSTEVFSIVMLEGWKPLSMSSAAIVFCRDHQHLMTLEPNNPERLTQNSFPSTTQELIDGSSRTRHNVEYLPLGTHHRYGRCIYSIKIEHLSDADNDELVSQTSVQLTSYSLNDGQVESCTTRTIPLPSQPPRSMNTKEICIYSGTTLIHDDNTFSPVLAPSVRIMYIE
ncbi:hypothetical protein DL93DRAFT_561193 [Clavulina sp. PMI_390]|nr:hypothetical protein DL93DRAFT_561193 [Clavulina sp. PMI_390]